MNPEGQNFSSISVPRGFLNKKQFREEGKNAGRKSKEDPKGTFAHRIYAEFLSKTSQKAYALSQGFHGALFKDDSLWISSWSKKNIGKNNDFILLNVNLHDLILRQMMEKPKVKAKLPAVMYFFANWILFTTKGDSEIYGLDTKTQKFQKLFSEKKIQIDAMCVSDDDVYIFDKRCPELIQILDSRFKLVESIATGLENISTCDVDLSIVKDERESKQHTCIISTSMPYPSVRAVNEEGGIWQIDSRRCPELDIRFNPCSVSASPTGDVFIADRGNDRVELCYIILLYINTCRLRLIIAFLPKRN